MNLPNYQMQLFILHQVFINTIRVSFYFFVFFDSCGTVVRLCALWIKSQCCSAVWQYECVSITKKDKGDSKVLLYICVHFYIYLYALCNLFNPLLISNIYLYISFNIFSFYSSRTVTYIHSIYMKAELIIYVSVMNW